MKFVTVNFDNGKVIQTSINGTEETIRAYYMGKYFNLGDGDKDLMAKAVSVTIMGETEEVKYG